jgi:CRISPR-associated protein Cmr4
MINKLLFIYTESSLHAGTGSSVSIVDLPIQRERSTQYPIVQGSGVKGAIRSQVAGGDPEVDAVFGADVKKGDHAGAVSFGDAQILLFPVRSLNGVYAYITCPFVVARLTRDLTYAGIKPSWGKIEVAKDGAKVISKNQVTVDQSVVLEEFTFNAAVDGEVEKFTNWLADSVFPAGNEYDYWRGKVKNSLVVLHDDAFRDFVVNSTEIVTRVRLETASKTVAQGALWTQEMLPADSLLYSPVVIRNTRTKPVWEAEGVSSWLADTDHLSTRIQLGGDETTGSGMVALKWAP